MLQGILGFSAGAGAVAILYETVLKKKDFKPPPPATKLLPPPPQQASQSPNVTTSSSTQQNFPSFLIPTTTDEIFVAPDEAYVSNFSTHLKTPRWVLEVIDAQKMKENKTKASGDRSNSKFFSNSTIPEPFRATNGAYSVRPGLSRGHLAAAQFHKGSQQEMDATFDLSLNIVPQDMTVNACDWFRLEQMCKALSKDFSKLFVLTGPAFVPEQQQDSSSSPTTNSKVKTIQYEVIGDREVAVPTHLFKCLLGQDPKNVNNYALGCFLMPNSPIAVEKPLTAFEVPVEQLEKMTGLSIFKEVRYNKGWYKLCTKHKCEGSYGSFSKNFRQIGVLRGCKSKQELDEKWKGIQAEHNATGAAIESSLTKEYQNKLKNFA